ncbi:helix-turn-helix domain-containing protein [Paractinoplanes rishiriensis]|uniref:Transcriptional regulator n=1 Tax=Paractinoplanes rishiriensis TaxID=1050105 RepID=A0A919JY17_9ACTN|nr:AraC family transcriptional regulator [Actinoplanes rishiriensis]GIE93056.1 transcriptional regulator [Actinoplanes rishiriensis]
MTAVTTPSLTPPGWAGVGTCTLGEVQPVGPWRPAFHALMLTTAGHGTVEVDFETRSCRPGTLLWIRPGQALRIVPNGLAAAIVTFETRLAGQHWPEQPEMPSHWQLEGEDEDAVISEFAQLAVDCERHRSGPIAADLLRHQLAVLLLRIALLTRPGLAGAEGRTFARFRRRLESGHPRSRRVEDYAEEMGCSVRTLTRASLAVTGRTAKQVVDDRVALEARRLLACSTLSVAEVGRHLGFPEPTNFGRFFHREVGMSPGQFRLEMASNGRAHIPAQRRPAD